MLFRIDSSSGFDDENRQYGFTDDEHVVLSAGEFESFIAAEISKEINGSKDRRLISCSKSLGVCLLKYNNYLDNGLHFSLLPSNTRAGYTELYYRTRNMLHSISYYLQSGIYDFPVNFECAELLNFIADVSDNAMLQKYFQKHLGKGKKCYASPKKDQEVVMMRLPDEKFIYPNNIEFVYVLYGLSMRYDFLNHGQIFAGVTGDVSRAFNEGRFNREEYEAIVSLIQYMACCGNYERNLSAAIRERNALSERISFCYDAVCEYDSIMTLPFFEAYELSCTGDVISQSLWKWCEIFLETD